MRFIMLQALIIAVVFVTIAALQMSGHNLFGTPLIPPNMLPPHKDMVLSDTTHPHAVPATSVVDALVAHDNIPAGTMVTPQMVEIAKIPGNQLPEGYVPAGDEKDNEGKDRVIGKISKIGLSKHAAFSTDALANQSDPGYLAASLPTRMRAITVAVDAVSGLAGYIVPGDHVDVMLTQSVPQGMHNADGSNTIIKQEYPVLSEVIAPNIRVIAVGTRNAATKDKDGFALPPSNVTIEISDEYAQRVRLAEKLGSLSLVLRSTADADTSIPNPTRLEELSRSWVMNEYTGKGNEHANPPVKPAVAAPKHAAQSSGITIIRGAYYDAGTTKSSARGQPTVTLQ